MVNEILARGFKKTEKDLWVGWHDYLMEDFMNPEYGYFLYATIHMPRLAFLNSDRLAHKMYKIILHRHYSYEYFERMLEDNESKLVYEGLIHTGEDLDFLLNRLGIVGK